MKEKAIKALEFITYWMLVLLPFSIAIAPAFTSAVISILFTFYFTKKILKKEGFKVTTVIDTPYLIFLVISLISIFNSHYYLASVRGVFKLVEQGLLFLIIVDELKDLRHTKRMLFALIFGACLASFDAAWQIYFGRDFIRGHEAILNIGLHRATAAFPNANVLGVYLSPIAPIIFGIALYQLKSKARVLLLLAAALVVIGIGLTFSRPAALALYLSVFIIALIKKDKLVITVLLAILIIIPFIAPNNIKKWAKEVKYNPIIMMCNYDRISIYRNTLNMIKHNPVLGVGLNTFSKNYLQYKLHEDDNAKTGDTIYAHNNFLHMAGEIGLIGLGVFIWLLICLFSFGSYLYKKLTDKYLKILCLCLIAGLAAFMINGLTETNLYYSRVSILFWYLAGFLLALKKFLPEK